MRFVDTIVCVKCGQREYRLAHGKSARLQNGVCESCIPKMEFADEVRAASTSTSDGSPSQSKGVPQGRPRSSA